MQTVYWLILFVILLIIEILTMGLTTIWFAGGALVAFVSGVIGFGLPVQVVAFLIVSVILLVLTRPLAVKYFNKERQKTNAESLIGEQALVTEDIDTLQAAGHVEIRGMVGKDRRTGWKDRKRYDRCSGRYPRCEAYCQREKKRGGVKKMPLNTIFLAILILIVVMLIISCVKIVRQAEALVIERLGAYQATWSTGLHFKVPIFDRVARRVDLKEQVVDFAPQPVITKDNVTMRIDTVVFYQITDPKMFCYGVANPIMAIENLTATTLRNIIGDLELDQTLTSRETINTKMRASLDVATDPWGIKVNRVELKNIIPPAAIQDAMEKQMKAERERREAILRAEGEKKSTILVAEGHKESAILDAEAEKQAAILKAEAQKEAMIREAEGEAEAILKVQQANADGIRFLKEAGADEAVLTMKSLEAFEKAADGKATKIIIPSEIQGIAGLVKSMTEIGGKDK